VEPTNLAASIEPPTCARTRKPTTDGGTESRLRLQRLRHHSHRTPYTLAPVGTADSAALTARRRPASTRCGIGSPGGSRANVILAGMSKPLPVAECTNCGRYSTELQSVNQGCGRIIDGKKCKGLFRSRIRPDQWRPCDQCAGSGWLDSKSCVFCQGTAWRLNDLT